MAENQQNGNTKYHVVKIQDLEPVKSSGELEKTDMKSHWKGKKCDHWGGKCECNVMYYTENNPANTRNRGNGFYGAFVKAYNNHEDIVLSPDDIWLMICLHFSKYINKYPEEMRHHFVSHEGKMKLSVTTWKERSESQWDEFFDLIIQEIQKNTKDNITDTLKCDFSTTTRIESIISTVSIMDSFKAYFEYGRCIPCCGIKQVKFMGKLEDWTKLLEKIQGLKKFAINKEWENYIDGVTPIVQKFIETYNGAVDVDFWNRIMNLKSGSLGSGSTTFVSGWILKFFGLNGEVDVGDIKEYNFDVPVEIKNYMTGQKKNVSMVGGFGGVYKEDEAYRPQLSMIVFHDGNVEPLTD